MNRIDATSIFQSFENQQVLIVGDVMLDRYVYGSVNRISPEAPVPILLQESMEDRLGGAANVAANVKALGGIPVLCSVLGKDSDGLVFQNLVSKVGMPTEGLVFSDARQTTVKTRIIGNHQQMLRIDQESTQFLFSGEEKRLLQKIESLLDGGNFRAMILQDYNKGVLSENVIKKSIEAAKKRGVLTTVDPKKENFFAYEGVDLFKPNLKEMRESATFKVLPNLESLKSASAFLRKKLQNRLTMITLSENGLFLDDGISPPEIFPTRRRNVADVSGAGDTVISIASMALAAGLDLKTIAALSNLSGGQVCEFTGVVPVDPVLLKNEFYHWLQIEKT